MSSVVILLSRQEYPVREFGQTHTVGDHLQSFAQVIVKQEASETMVDLHLVLNLRQA